MMIELKINNEKIKKCKVNGYGAELMAELIIGVSALLYCTGGKQKKSYEFWRKILTEEILSYEKVKELLEDEG